MGMNQLRRGFYGQAVGSNLLQYLPVPSLYALGTTPTGQAVQYTDLQGRSLRNYILEKHSLNGRYWTGQWYFGRCRGADGRIIGGTEHLSPYPFRVYYDNGSGLYGTLPLGAQGTQGRIITLGARMDFRKYAAATASAAVGVGDTAQGVKVLNTNTSSATGIGASAAGLKFSLAQGVIASNATQTAAEAASAGTGTASITDGVLSNLIIFTSTGTLSSGAQNFAALSPVNTAITDSSGGTASTTFAAITATVTSTVVANALAQLAANENKRLGLFGAVLGGTSAVQGLFLNLGSTTTADGDDGTDNAIAGELLLNGVVEVHGLVLGDI